MECKILLDAADVGNLLQITVEFLIGDYGHQLTVEILAFILFQYLDGGRKQWNSHLCVGFLTVCDYPQPSVKHLLDVVNTQVGKVDVCQSGEAGEHEYVAHLFETLGGELLFHHIFQVVFREKTPVNPLHRDFVAVEGVHSNQPGTDGLVDYLLKELHALVGGVLAVAIFRAEEELQIDDELVLDFTQGNVGDVVFLFHELHHTPVHTLVFLIGGVRLAQSDELFGVFKMLLVEWHQRFFLCGNAGKGVLYHFGCNVAVAVEDVVVVFFKNVAHILDALVELGNF